MKKLYLLLSFFVILFACSEDRAVNENKQAINTNVRVIHDNDPPTGQGDIPRSKLIYKSMNVNDFTLTELYERYKKDIEVTAPDYHDNLKNYWFSIIGERISEEGSDEMKKYFLEEQLSLKNNLLNFEKFYKLLLASSLNKEESLAISNKFYQNNKKAIAEIIWKTEKEEKDKLSELIYAKRTYEILIRNNK